MRVVLSGSSLVPQLKRASPSSLPDAKLPETVVAMPDVVEAVKDATALVFVLPHQCAFYLGVSMFYKSHPARPQSSTRRSTSSRGTSRRAPRRSRSSRSASASSCHGSPSSADRGSHAWQGVDVKGDDIHIFADLIEQELGVSCSSLSGANIATEVAADRFSGGSTGDAGWRLS